MAGEVALGTHEVLEPCDMRHRPWLGTKPCRTGCGTRHTCLWCHDTGQIRKCTICLTVDCDGVHDYCLNCDGSALRTCPTCEGEGYNDDQVACPTCEGNGEVDCPECTAQPTGPGGSS